MIEKHMIELYLIRFHLGIYCFLFIYFDDVVHSLQKCQFSWGSIPEKKENYLIQAKQTFNSDTGFKTTEAYVVTINQIPTKYLRVRRIESYRNILESYVKCILNTWNLGTSNPKFRFLGREPRRKSICFQVQRFSKKK